MSQSNIKTYLFVSNWILYAFYYGYVHLKYRWLVSITESGDNPFIY